MNKFPLFELTKSVSFGCENATKSDKDQQVVHYAWKEAGERSFLALLFSNGYILLRYSIHGRPPIVRQMPWHPDRPIQSMCFDSTATWLLCVTDKQILYIVPVLALMDPKAQVDQIWRVDDVTRIRAVKRRGIPTCVTWWHTLDGQNVAIVGTKLGFVQFIHLEKGTGIAEADVNEYITSIELVHNDAQTLTYALITTKSNSQWKLFLEVLGTSQQWPDDDELLNLGFEQIDNRHVPVNSILKQSDETSHEFLPLKFYQFASSVVLSPQYAKGRHFVAAHDLRSSLYQIYDSNLEHSPLYVYRVPEGVDHVILTDRMLFQTSSGESTSLCVLANQMTEASADGTQEFNREALVQQFDIAPEEQVLAVLKRSFPFYWHEKREEEARSRTSSSQTSDSDSTSATQDAAASKSFRISSHTVLDGCLVVTSHGIYECRPRISPERLFLQLALDQSDTSPAEHLAIALGLDINALYQMAALYRLDHADYPQAYRFFQLAKTPHSKRVAYFAKYGRISEVMIYLQATLTSKSHELSVVERGRLADLALLCHLHLSLVQGSPSTDTTGAFRDFLMTNRWFDKKIAVKLLSDYGFTDLLVEYAKVKGLSSEVTEHVLGGSNPGDVDMTAKLSHVQLQKSAAGPLLHMYTPSSLSQLLSSRPQVASNFLEQLRDDLHNMEPMDLMKVAVLLDMSRPPLATYVRQTLAKQKRRRHLSASSFTSLSSEVSHQDEEGNIDMEGIHIHQLVEVFAKAIILLNAKRKHTEFTLADIEACQPPEDQDCEEETPPSYCLLPHPQPVSCGADHTGAVVDGRLYTWGMTKHGRLGVGTGMEEVQWKPLCLTTFPPSGLQVMSVACGGQHTLALTQDGRVYGWGRSNFGQVGTGRQDKVPHPSLISRLAGAVCVSVAAGQHHSLALTQDCSLFSWGWGVHGQLGQGHPEDVWEPTCVAAMANLHPARIAAGYAHSIVCSVQGSVYTFGNGMFGQLGLGALEKTSLPEKVELPEPICSIATGSFHNLALSDTGRLYQWGAPPQVLRYAVQVHRRARQQGKAPPPTDLIQLTDHLQPRNVNLGGIDGKVNQVHCGSNFSAVVTRDGEVFTWGKNLDGQLGIGNRMEQKNPVMVFKINDRKIAHLDCGLEYVVAIDTDGQLWGWGRNDNGQLGVPLGPQQQTSEKRYGVKITEVLYPVRIEGIPKVPQPHRPADDTLLLEECLQDPGLKLPDLRGSADQPYEVEAVLAVIKSIPQFCNLTQLRCLAVDHQCWGTAACICLLSGLYSQALHYHLQTLLAQHPENAPVPPTEGAAQVSQYYLRRVLSTTTDQRVQEIIISQLLEEVFMFWGQKSLPLVPLENLLSQHLDDLAFNIFSLMGSKNAGHQNPDGNGHTCAIDFSLLFERMSSGFLLSLTRTVVGLIDKNKLSAEQLHKLCPGLQPLLTDQISVDKSISPEKLWQEILQNLKKDLDVRSHISLSQSQLEILKHNGLQHGHHNGHDASTADTNSQASDTAILFTCGHHFAKNNFLETVLPSFEDNLSKRGSPLPQATTLLSTYYRRKGPHPMACPTCVLHAIGSS